MKTSSFSRSFGPTMKSNPISFAFETPSWRDSTLSRLSISTTNHARLFVSLKDFLIQKTVKHSTRRCLKIQRRPLMSREPEHEFCHPKQESLSCWEGEKGSLMTFERLASGLDMSVSFELVRNRMVLYDKKRKLHWNEAPSAKPCSLFPTPPVPEVNLDGALPFEVLMCWSVPLSSHRLSPESID